LWQARFFKTRTVAAGQVRDTGVRINGTRITKPAAAIGPGDTLTFAQGRIIRVVRIVALATRRVPAPEAQALYDDLTPHEAPKPARVGARPTKKDRRDMDVARDRDDPPA
jgi:ribosome-associated heat shock protein Hsp15